MPECLIKCGVCCKEDWNSVLTNRFLHKHGFGNVEDYNQCPFLQENGCSLPRKNRPKPCLSYLCYKAKKRLED